MLLLASCPGLLHQLLVPGTGQFAHLLHIVRGVQEGSEASPWPWDGCPGDEGEAAAHGSILRKMELWFLVRPGRERAACSFLTLSSRPIYSLYLEDLDHNPPASSTQSLTRGGSSSMRSRPQCLGPWDEGLWADCPTISQHSRAPALIQTQLAEQSARMERYSAGLEEREQREFPVPSPREGHTDIPPPSLLPLAGKARQSLVSMATTGSPVPAGCLQRSPGF